MLNPSHEGFSCHILLLTLDWAVVKLSKPFHSTTGRNWPCVVAFNGFIPLPKSFKTDILLDDNLCEICFVEVKQQNT